MPSRVNERYAIIELEIKGHNDEKANNAIIYSVITLYESEGFVSSHSDALIPPCVTSIATYNEIFCYSSKTKDK